MKRFLLV